MSDEDKKAIAPIKIGGGAIMTPDNAAEMFDETTGAPQSPIDILSLYNQGKEDYWAFGEGEKKESVLGIFLYRANIRAFWHPDKDMDGSAPSCLSFDGQQPHGLVEEKENEGCGDCPWNKLGTAKIGRGKACKAKAADFIIEVPDNVEIGEDGKAYVDPERVLGPALMRYSTANREGAAEWERLKKAAKEIGTVPYPQAILARWGFQKSKSKSGVEYCAIKLEAVAPLPSMEEDPDLWGMIGREVKMLREGTAADILVTVSGLNSGDDES